MSMVTHCRRCGGIVVSYAMHYCPDEEHLKPQPEPRRLESPEAAPAPKDALTEAENDLLYMQDEDMGSNLREAFEAWKAVVVKAREAAPAEGVRTKPKPPQPPQPIDHWAVKRPGLADQYRGEALAARVALGLGDEKSDDVSPADITEAINNLRALSRSEAAPKAAEAEPPKQEWEGDLVWREGCFRIRPAREVKVGESAWPFADGKYVRVRTVTESQPHKVHPYDSLEAMKADRRILFFTVDSRPLNTIVTLFPEGARWVEAQAPTLADAVVAAERELQEREVAGVVA